MASISISLSSSLFGSPLPHHNTRIVSAKTRPTHPFSGLIRCSFAAPRRNSSSYSSGAPGRKSSSYSSGAPGRNSSYSSDAPGRKSSSYSSGAPERKPSSYSSPKSAVVEKKRHWKQGEFPATSIQSPPSSYSSPSRSYSSSKSPVVEKKRLWKQGEFPGTSSQPSQTRRTPIKDKKKMDLRERAKAWVCTVTESLVDRIQKKQWVEALEVFEMLREQPFYHPKEGTYMKLIVLLGKSGQPQHAHRLFDLMVEEGCEPTAALYTALLGAYCRSNLIDEAFTILNQMKTLPQCQPDVYSYSILIKACIDASHYDMVASLYEEMDQRSISPNTVTQNIVLSGYGRAEKYDQMEKVLSAMLESKTSKPDVWTMNIILSIFGNKGDIEIMERWYEKFRNFGVEPETRTFNILIGAYGKKRMYDKMSSVMEYMRKLEFPWTTSTYNNVIEAFADVGDAKQMEYTFEQMRAEGMRADTKTFCCLINGYANAGMFHKVMSSVQLAGKLEVRENTSFFNAIISACAKADDLMEMERVYKRMKDKQCQPDLTTYSVMVETYRKNDMNDKIYYLELEKEMFDNAPQKDEEAIGMEFVH